MEDIPNLTEFYSFERTTFLQHDELYSKIPSKRRDQLQLIYLSADLFFGFGDNLLTHHLPFRFVNLKHLEFEVRQMRDTDLYRFRSLIDAYSSLEKLKLKFLWLPLIVGLIEFEESKAPTCYRHIKLSPKLKVLKVEGYAGSPSEFDLASYIIYYAKNLERVTVEACAASKRLRRRALARAQQDFRLISPPSLDLVFI